MAKSRKNMLEEMMNEKKRQHIEKLKAELEFLKRRIVDIENELTALQ